jgi:hypothetical protein
MSLIARLCLQGLIIHCPVDHFQVTAWVDGDPVYVYPGESINLGHTHDFLHMEVWPTDSSDEEYAYDIVIGGRCDIDFDGASGTDQDLEAFFNAYWDGLEFSDFNNNGITGLIDDDFEQFYWALSGGQE